jgi:hypothetical protein
MDAPQIFLSGPITSGPMAGRPWEEAAGTFRRAAAAITRALSQAGVAATLWVPTEEVPPDTSWEAAMETTLGALAESSAVVCLAGWEDSAGASAEVSAALSRNIPVASLGDFLADPQAVLSGVVPGACGVATMGSCEFFPPADGEGCSGCPWVLPCDDGDTCSLTEAFAQDVDRVVYLGRPCGQCRQVV